MWKKTKTSSRAHNLTLCGQTKLDQADYIFLSAELNYGSLEEVLRNVKRYLCRPSSDGGSHLLWQQHVGQNS